MRGRPTWAEIDLDALVGNYRALAGLLDPGRRLIPVVKADAYGHGAVHVSRALVRAGATALAVAMVEEGVALRDSGITLELLVLQGAWPGQETQVVEYNLTPALFSFEGARRLEQVAAARSVQVPVHIKIDSGMTRLGAPWNDLGAFLDSLREAANIRVAGTFSHLACADELESRFTRKQLSRFGHALQELRKAGIDPGEIHVGNSAGLLYWDELRSWGARPGIALYGYPPAPQRCPVSLKPVLTLKSRIGRILTVPPRESVGYGRRFIAGRQTRTATIPAGYADGYRRSLGGKARVIIRDRLADVLGTISMDMIVADVTDIPEADVGDDVILLGSSPGCRVDAADWASLLGTIPYEVLCGIGPRVPRIYLPASLP